MIRYLRGIFHPGLDGVCVVETAAGIGFQITIAVNSPLYRHLDGEEIKVYTLMTVHDNDVNLYGFSTAEELEFFRLLLTVTGFGPAKAMAVMGILPVRELKGAIARGDVGVLTSASGVGKRYAQRLILELKDKMGEDAFLEGASSAGSAPPVTSQRKEASEALTALGYSKNEAEDAVARVSEEDLTSEEYIRRALRSMKKFF